MADTPVTVQNRPDRPLSPIGIGVILATVAIDQIAKLIAERSLDYGQPIDLLPILSLYRVHNPGIAFSLLSSFGALGLVAVTAVVAAFVLSMWQRTEDGGRLAAIGYAMIIGGALGNLVDRKRRLRGILELVLVARRRGVRPEFAILNTHHRFPSGTPEP